MFPCLSAERSASLYFGVKGGAEPVGRDPRQRNDYIRIQSYNATVFSSQFPHGRVHVSGRVRWLFRGLCINKLTIKTMCTSLHAESQVVGGLLFAYLSGLV